MVARGNDDSVRRPLEQPEAVAERRELERGHPLARRVGLILGPLLFLFLLLGPDIGLDALQRRAAAITALTATFWLTVAIPVGATSLLPAALFPLFGVLSARDAASVYMHDLVMLFLGAFVVALGLERWGVHRRLALWLISRIGTRPRTLVLGFMVAAAVLSMWINNTATTLMMLPIGVAVVGAVGAREGAGEGEREGGGAFAPALLLGIAYAASIGGMTTPVGTAPNQVFLGQFELHFPDAPAIGFGEWVLAWLPLGVLLVVAAWWLLARVLFRVPAGSNAGAEAIRAERARLGPMGRGAKTMAAIFALTALLWVTRADLRVGGFTLPGWAGALARLQARGIGLPADFEGHVTDSTVALTMAALCFLIPVDRARGVFLMAWKTAGRLPWDVLLLIGSGFCIAKGFSASGLDSVLGGAMAPLLAGSSDWVVVGGLVSAMTFLTEITSNTATTNVFLPVLARASVEGGLHPLVMMAPVTVAASAAFMLPVATPPNAVVYSSRLVSIPTMAKAGFFLNLVSIVLITLVFQLWVRGLWGVTPTLPAWAAP